MNKIYLLLTSFFLLKVNIALADDLKIVSAEKFIAENPSPEREKIVNFIVHQFDNKKRFTQEELDEIWKYKDSLELQMVRFQIVDQKLYADSFDSSNTNSITLVNYFQSFIKEYKVPDLDFIVYAVDFMPSDSDVDKKILGFPAFMFSKSTNHIYEKDKLLLPDFYITSKGWGKLANRIKKANLNNPWENKIERIFWRGASTNGIYSISNFSDLPRLKLVMLSKLFPESIDASFSKYVQFSKDSGGNDLRKILRILFGKKTHGAHEVDHLKYKYLVSVDGNTCAWLRVPWIMLSNSVLLKQETDKIEWFYSAIDPYIHYVPVNEDLLNIFSQLEWMKNNDNKLKEISNNATKFVENNLMPEHIDAYTAIILNEYHKLQEGQKIKVTLDPAEELMNTWTLTRVLFNIVKKKFINWVDSF